MAARTETTVARAGRRTPCRLRRRREEPYPPFGTKYSAQIDCFCGDRNGKALLGTRVAFAPDAGLPPSGGSMSIVAWIVLGLIAGAIAKALMPGRDPGGIIVTILIGIVGAFLGGFLGNMIAGTGLNGFSLWSIILAVLGAMLLLWIYRLATRPRRTM